VACDLMSISPKLSNSTPSRADRSKWVLQHERQRHAPEVIRRLVADYTCQFKFVVESIDDCREVERYLAELPEIERARVMLMPEGTDVAVLAGRARWLKPYCDEHGLVYCPRRQIEWFGLGRAT
jgi:7-carboxy-7-deazaguanine synthase